MKVSFIVTHLSHGSPGSFYRPYEMSKQLAKLKIENDIYTPFTEDVKNIHDASMIEIKGFGQKLNMSNFLYGTFRKIIYNNRLSRFTSYDKLIVKLSDQLSSKMEKSIKTLPDIFQGEQLVGSISAIKLGKKLKIPIVVDIHNIWAEELVADGFLKKNSNQFKNLITLEDFVIKNSDGIIVVNEYMKNYLITNFNVDPSKITIIPPGGDFSIDLSDAKLMEERFSHKKIVYAGLINPREHVDLFVKSIPRIKNKFPNTKIIISKKGDESKKIFQLSKSLGVKPQFYWFKSRDKARNLIKTCYVGALPSKNDIPRKLGTPLKLLEYMSLGIPVVANDIGSWCDIIQKYKIGILTNDVPRDFAEGICTLIEDENLYRKMQKNIAKALKEKFNWEILVKKKLIPLYQKLCS